jgi:V8-like Glu-specific endopeptidase
MNRPISSRLSALVVAVIWACVVGLPQGAAPTALAASPCLSGDPYDLAQLAQVIERTTPPSAPVTINQHIIVQYIQSGVMEDGAEDSLSQGTAPPGSSEPREPPAQGVKLDEVPMRIFNTATGFEYRVTMSDTMLRSILTCHEQAGLTEAGGPGDFGRIEGQIPLHLPLVVQNGSPPAQGSTPAELGWSNSDDTRIVRSPTTAWPWRAITQSSSWPNGERSRCTMTLIGPRHLVTAAHCLVDFGTSNWKARKLIPARNGPDVAPYGISQMTPNPPPGTSAWYIVPDPWLDPSTPNDIDRFQWDIGLVLMIDRLGDQTGWMGYGAYTASDLNTRSHLNRGYPSCDPTYAERPDGNSCQEARLYGDTKLCAIGDYHNPGSNGWNREFSFSCDISRGHSGSPIYHYRYSPSKGKDVPVVIAVVSWHECTTCASDDVYPNHARRITPWVLGRISWLREQFP